MVDDKIYDNYELRALADVVPYDIQDMRERYLKLYTALIYDSMEAYGMSGRSMESGIYPLTIDMKVAGPAFTVRRQTTPNMDTYTHNIRLGLIKSMCDGCILLSDVQGNKNCGQFGEITATAMRAAGCAGAVIDGSTRDSNYLINMNFPTFCRFRNPVEGLGRSMIVDYMIPIFVNGIDGLIRVDPGDFIFGDNDGVVIVPKDQTVRVLEQAEVWFENEKKSRQAMAEGMNPFEVYNKYGRF
jgi:4-hydroxy-4-methyl-2-oxoglutarate aldolase